MTVPTLSSRIATERPAHRLERLGAWMQEEKLDLVVAFGADEVN
jgi:hypothetical protein